MKKLICFSLLILASLVAFFATNGLAVCHQDNQGQNQNLNNIILYTDNVESANSWKVEIEAATGMEVHIFKFNSQDSRTKEAIDDFKNNNHLKELHPKAVFFQIGCNGVPDTNDQYDRILFDYPVGDVCTLTGKMGRHKRIAISKPDRNIRVDNFGGTLYFMIRTLRDTHRDARVFILSPSEAGATANPTSCRQLDKIANMLCVPFITKPEELPEYNYLWNGFKPKLGKMLILGDSYCQQRRWINSLEKLTDVEVVNLGVTSASMRDHFTDRAKYPYSGNPVQSDCSGNHNTLACQLVKLHRLLSGRGLLQGEQSLQGWQPDIILIEGGGNDFADSPEVEAQYESHIRNDIRTSFAGSLSYLTKDLHATFPNAKIFIVVSAGLYYGHTDKPFEYIDKANQQRKVAEMLGYPTVNWDKDCRLSFIFNNSAGTGDGSTNRPFRYNAATYETIDMIHPNDYGAQFLAESAVHWITKNLFIP